MEWFTGKRGIIAAIVTALTGAAIAISINVRVKVDIRPGEFRHEPPAAVMKFGWDGDLDPVVTAANAAAVQGQIPLYAMPGDQPGDNPKRRVVLWDVAKTANHGHFLKTVAQVGQDCVGGSSTNAVQLTQLLQAALGYELTEFKPIFVPYHYAYGRMAPECGNGWGRRNPAGSYVAWQALALQQGGVLPQDAVAADGERLPAYDQRSYATWSVRMPAAKWVAIGRMHPVQSIAKLPTSDDVRRATQNLYVVLLGSQYGSTAFRTQDGRLVARWNTTWSHATCIIGYDGETASGTEYFYYWNNWGDNAHPAPIAGEQPGGFWITRDDLDRILATPGSEAWAISGFEGFPAQNIDFFDRKTSAVKRPQIKEDRPCVPFEVSRLLAA